MPDAKGYRMQRAQIKSSARQRFNRGVTLVELMVTIVILAILAAIGMPAMARFINDTRVSGTTNEFVSALNLARMEAIKRGRLVTVCRSTNPESEAATCTSGSDWSTGWIVFIEDSSGGALGTNVAADNILTRRGTLTTNVNAQVNNTTPITYNGTGLPVGNLTGISINFNYNGGCARAVSISRSGRVTVIPDGTPCGS
jgi:type IV fimbrial biogenesis protein FimT